MKFPFLQADISEDKIKMISLNEVVPNPHQPRRDFDQKELEELAESIKNYGVIQPITVRINDEDKYELIAGERRLRASKLLKLEKIPAVIRDFSNQEMAEVALVENLQRRDLDFLEEARAYQQLLEKFNLTQQELAEKIGKSQSTIANKLRLLNLPTDVRKFLNSPVISERHARALLKLKSLDDQLEIVRKIIENELTVKETEVLVKKILNPEKEEKKVVTLYRDLRLFTNTLNKTIEEIKTAGIDLKVEKEEKEGFIEYKILFPKKGYKRGDDIE